MGLLAENTIVLLEVLVALVNVYTADALDDIAVKQGEVWAVNT